MAKEYMEPVALLALFPPSHPVLPSWLSIIHREKNRTYRRRRINSKSICSSHKNDIVDLPPATHTRVSMARVCRFSGTAHKPCLNVITGSFLFTINIHIHYKHKSRRCRRGRHLWRLLR